MIVLIEDVGRLGKLHPQLSQFLPQDFLFPQIHTTSHAVSARIQDKLASVFLALRPQFYSFILNNFKFFSDTLVNKHPQGLLSTHQRTENNKANDIF